MKTAHTPGPWIHRTRLDDGANIGCKDGYAICDMAYKYSSLSREELDADAKLIAAAPELLAALHGLLHYRGNIPDVFTEAADKAIAKATGVAA